MHFQFEVVSDVATLDFGVRLRLASNGETITTVRKTLSDKPLKAGTKGKVEFLLRDTPLRPNELSIYSWLAPADGKMSYDVVDENVDLPYLKIISSSAEYVERDGLLTLPNEITMLELE